MVVDTIGELIGDVASLISDAVVRFLIRNLNVSSSRGINVAAKIAVYLLIIIPITVAVIIVMVYVLFYVGVFLLNWWLRSATS